MHPFLLHRAPRRQVGGVVVKSPLEAIAAYEREHGLPPDYINCSMYVLHVMPVHVRAHRLTRSGRTARGRSGAWQQFERGEIPLLVFYEAFGRELSDATHANAAYEAFCARKRLSTMRPHCVKGGSSSYAIRLSGAAAGNQRGRP
jgi:hypothetical protein